MALIDCEHPYDGPDIAYVARILGLTRRQVSFALHRLKNRLGGKSVIICLDDGEVYLPPTNEPLGNIKDAAQGMKR